MANDDPLAKRIVDLTKDVRERLKAQRQTIKYAKAISALNRKIGIEETAIDDFMKTADELIAAMLIKLEKPPIIPQIRRGNTLKPIEPE